MKRYYSHYTFIYPGIFLRNHIVELDEKGYISSFFPYEREIERTEFVSGLQVFLPEELYNQSEITLQGLHPEIEKLLNERTEYLVRSFLI